MSGLESEFPGKIQTQNVDATTAESKAAIQALGFAHHGLVIRDPKSGDALWKQADHDVVIEDVRQAIRRLRP